MIGAAARRSQPSASPPPAGDAPTYALPPGPNAPRMVQTLNFVRRPFEWAEQCARRYGDCYTIRLLGFTPGVVFSAPDAVKDVFGGDPDTFRAGESNRRILEPLLGMYSLLILDGERHLRERRLMMPPFHGERMHLYGRVMREIADDAIDSWIPGRSIGIHAAMQRITLEVILRVVFGVEDHVRCDQLRPALLRFLALAEGPAAALLAVPALQIDLGGFSPWGRFMGRVAAIDELLYAEIARRRTSGIAGRTDILSLLMAARAEDGTMMGDRELRDEMFTLLLAGHETLATSLAWVLYHVLTREDVLAAIRDELHSVVGERRLEYQHVPQLRYLDAVLKETARVNPVLDLIGRQLGKPARIGGHDLPAGTLVMVSSYLAHRRPQSWPEPERFRPERFLGPAPSPYAYVPFGGGVRRCLGAAFAGFEMKIVLAEVLSRVDLRVKPGYRPRVVRRAITLGPSHGVPVVVERCRPAR